jgi:hypothetical protein
MDVDLSRVMMDVVDISTTKEQVLGCERKCGWYNCNKAAAYMHWGSCAAWLECGLVGSMVVFLASYHL